MKAFVTCFLLLAPVLAAGPFSPPASSSRVASAHAQAASEATTRLFQPESPLDLEGSAGFRSLYYLLNRSAWPDLPGDGTTLRSGSAVIGLADPLQSIVVFNAWHLPAASSREDIRLVDLRKHILRSTVVFTSTWPDYTTPGFIVLVQKRDREWALVARLSGHYLVEDRSGIGVCAIPAP